jgi:hypothetical protein
MSEAQVENAVRDFVASNGDISYTQDCIRALSDFIANAMQPMSPRVSVALGSMSDLDKANRLIRLSVTIE